MDEAVSVDASAVGWTDTPAGDAVETDSGWATFDNFTSINMAAGTYVNTLGFSDCRTCYTVQGFKA